MDDWGPTIKINIEGDISIGESNEDLLIKIVLCSSYGTFIRQTI